uniref:Uncharacterized protein n=1 Tax=Oryza glumipatula TaxID=40148 RepID=A0A0E0A890_9ORYZ
MKLGERHRIAVQIRNLKSRIDEVSNRNTRYSLIKPISSITTEDERDSYLEDARNRSGSNTDESELVGFAKTKDELLKLIDVNTNDGPAKVICVVGMGGLGKTTIARKAYENKEHMKNFSCCAWITVSQSFDRKEILKQMIRQLLGADSLDKLLKEFSEKLLVQVQHLADHSVEGLKEKRYLVVLDDLWTIDAWNWIHDIAFPKINNRGSRIIITTRDAGLAGRCTSESLIYHLEPLHIDDAIHLLLAKTNIRLEDMKNDEDLGSIVTKLVKRCGYLPLAILTIGGILATKKIMGWGKFYRELPSELESNPSLEAMRRMVTLSYNHLPSHLKPCFLYLSIFPEDFEIQRGRLVDRWIAEGFVRATDGVNIEDVGNSHFNELINRSLIQPSKVSTDGVVKRCRIHDIMRDIIVSISREENFVLLTREKITVVAEESIRHLAFHGSKCSKIFLEWNHLRSVTLFGDRPVGRTPALCSPQFRMLRVLDLEDAKFKFTQNDIRNIGLLRHMKYLNFARASTIYTLPRSIGKLQCLQILNMREANISALTTEVTKLQNLRSLRCSRRSGSGYFSIIDNPKECLMITMCLPMVFSTSINFSDRVKLIPEICMSCSTRWYDTKGVRVPRGIDNLKELQILEVVDINRTSRKAIEELGELIQLRKLSVTTKGATNKKYQIFCAAIEKLSSLQSLRVDAEGFSDTGTLEWLNSIACPPPFLKTLKLNGSLADTPNWFGNLKQLVKMCLSRCGLKDGKTMEILGALPNLMVLRLYRNAYADEKMTFRRGTFPNLRCLDIYLLKQLREIRFEEGTSPTMESIEIYGCRLESGIIGIKHLPRLKIISLEYDGKVAKLDVLQEEVNTHPNHTELQMAEDRSHHDLGDCSVQKLPTSLSPCAVVSLLVLSLKGESNESMAETVLSMARSLVGSAISKAASAAANETSLLLGVEKDICSYVPTSPYLPALLAHASSNHTVTDQLPTAADFCLICHRRPSPSISKMS